MQEETERMVAQVAKDVSKGLVSYDRAKRQLQAWSRAKPSIDIGEAIDWLDRNIKKSGYEEVGGDIVAPVDHSHYYDEPKAANREIMAEQKRLPLIARTNVDSGELAKAQERTINVTSRVQQLTSAAEEEMGVIDVDPETGEVV